MLVILGGEAEKSRLDPGAFADSLHSLVQPQGRAHAHHAPALATGGRFACGGEPIQPGQCQRDTGGSEKSTTGEVHGKSFVGTGDASSRRG
jgi:hypothetical protein